MILEEKKAEILRALDSGEVSQRNIDTTKGRDAKKLRKGLPMGEKTIERMYQALINVRQHGNAKDRGKAKAGEAAHRKPTQRPEEQTKKLIEENRWMKATILDLEKELAELKRAQRPTEGQQTCYTIEDKVNGFHLKQEKTITTRYNKDGSKHTMEYVKYYAKKRLASKLHRIYIGETLERGKVEAKIEAYLEKHGIVIE